MTESEQTNDDVDRPVELREVATPVTTDASQAKGSVEVPEDSVSD